MKKFFILAIISLFILPILAYSEEPVFKGDINDYDKVTLEDAIYALQIVAGIKQITDREPKVIVVGAGLSGLIAALHLENNGIDVTILEKEPRVGGRIYSVPLGGTYANLGAQYFFKSESSTARQK